MSTAPFWSKSALVERVFVGALAVLCVGLTILQWQWTGQVSVATTQTLHTDFSDETRLLCQSFDADLSNACDQLLPSEGELSPGNREATHLAHYRRWQEGQPRPMFRRMGVAIPSGGDVDLLLIDPTRQSLTPVPWPAEWTALHENLVHKGRNGHSMPFEDATGTLMEFPVFGRGGGTESEWFILEFDLDYVSKKWMPELVRRYLDRGGRPLSEVTVRATADSSQLIFRTGADRAAGTEDSTTVVRFNNQGGRTGESGPPGKRGSWTLTARPLPGALDAAVAMARRRNFAVSGLLIGLTLAAGLMLVRFTRRSRRLAEAQMQFVAGVSHELRTPLTVIRGAAHNLQRGIARQPAQIEQYARLILQHSDQLGGMIEQVLELANRRRHGVKYFQERVELPDILREAIAATTADATAAWCRVESEIAADLPVITGDAGALRRVFQNLLVNAAKHGGTGGWIGVSALTVGGGGACGVEVSISDRGAGVPREEQARIFEPFFRGADAQRRQTRGSGLGLSLVREIVEAHGGSVALRGNGNGSGATFVVRLPTAAASEPAAMEAAVAMSPS